MVELPGDAAGAYPAAQRAKWAKIGPLRQTLSHDPLAVWLDADVLLMREDEDVAAHLHPNRFRTIAMSRCHKRWTENGSRTPANNPTR